MNVKTFGIVAALVLSVSLLTMNIAHPVMAKGQDKCSIGVSKELEGAFAGGCSTDNQAANAAKKLCQQTSDNKEINCSSSQTAHGNMPNTK